MFLETRNAANRRRVREHRRAPRYRFEAAAEITEKASGTKTNARVCDLSLYGCYVDMSTPLAEGTAVSVKILTNTDFFESDAIVVYTHANFGIGLAFRNVKPYFLVVMKKWLVEATKGE